MKPLFPLFYIEYSPAFYMKPLFPLLYIENSPAFYMKPPFSRLYIEKGSRIVSLIIIRDFIIIISQFGRKVRP